MSAIDARRAAIVVGSLFVAASVGHASTALAAGSRVVIVRGQAGTDPVIDRAEVRLAAELRAAGFEVEERPPEGDADARRLLEEQSHGEAFATVLLQRVGAGPATDVWVADHVTHKTVVRRISAQGSDENATRALALRVVELMRASLVEAIVLPAPQDTPRPPPDVVAWTREAIPTPPRAEPSVAHLVVGAGIAAVFASPEVGFAVGPELRIGWRASSAWSVRATAAGPALGGSIRAPAGDATLRQELAVVELSLERPMGSRVNVLAALGVGAYHIDARGNARPPYTNAYDHDSAWSVLASLGGGALFPISEAMSIEIDARALLAMPRPVIVFGSERVATAMVPGALAGLTLTIGL
jgi:hypothetical protein